MLVTLLVLWVVVVPALTLAGTYVLSGVLGRLHGRGEYSPVIASGPVRIAARRQHRASVRMRGYTRRSRDHALIQR